MFVVAPQKEAFQPEARLLWEYDVQDPCLSYLAIIPDRILRYYHKLNLVL